MYHICYLIIASCESVAYRISEWLNWLKNLNLLGFLLVLRNRFEVEISFKLSANFVQVSFFVLLWTYKLIELLSQIFVDYFVKLIKFIIQLLLFFFLDYIILGLIIRLKHADEHDTWGILMLNRCPVKLQEGFKCIRVVSEFSNNHS